MAPSANPPCNDSKHSYPSTMKRQARSNLIKLIFADDELGVSSTICEDLADQNQIKDELTNPNPSKTMVPRENDNVSKKVSLKTFKNKKTSYQLFLRGSTYQWRQNADR